MKIYSSEISGSLKVKGDIKAENYIVQSTVSQITRSFASGSSIFGDGQNDTHQFTGSLFVTSSKLTIDSKGSVSGSATSTGSFGKVSISDRLHIGVPASPNNGLRYIDGSGFRIISDDDIHLEMSDVFKFVGGSLQIGSSTFLDTSNNATFASLKTTGNISGSSTSTGSFGDG